MCIVAGAQTTSDPQAWRGLNAYAARLARDNAALARHFGVEALAGALDGQAEFRHAHAHAPRMNYAFAVATDADRQELAMHVAIAADWLRFSGTQLRRVVVGGRAGAADKAAASVEERDDKTGSVDGTGDNAGAAAATTTGKVGSGETTANDGDAEDNAETGKEEVLGEEKWQFWKRRWAEIAQLAAIDDETRRLAREAHEAMERLEKEA